MVEKKSSDCAFDAPNWERKLSKTNWNVANSSILSLLLFPSPSDESERKLLYYSNCRSQTLHSFLTSWVGFVFFFFVFSFA